MGTAETPAPPIMGLIFSFKKRFMILARTTPAAAALAKETTPRMRTSRVLGWRKFCAGIAAPMARVRKMVMRSTKVVCAVWLSLSVTPHSLKRFPSMKQPIRGAEVGTSRMTIMDVIKGKTIFSSRDTFLSEGFM
jgi:hypothetical protein